MKQVVALLLIVSVALAAVSIDGAQTIVTPYVYQGEQIDIQPQKLTTSGSTSYWVMETKSLNQIQVMFPVDYNTGIISRSVAIKPVLKTHYLANFYVTSNSIPNFLDETLTYAQQQQSDLDQKIRNFETNVEPFIPQGVSFTNKDSYKTTVRDAINKSAILRDLINSLKLKINSVTSPADITTTQSSFSAFFAQESALLDSLNKVVTAADKFHVEINQDVNNGTIDSSFGSSMVFATTHSIDTIQRRDSLTSNKNTIDSFYSSLDTKADDYFIKLNNRVSQSADEILKKQVIEILNNYSNQYSDLNGQGTALSVTYRASSGFDSDLSKLYNLLNQSYASCSGSSSADTCSGVKSNYPQMDTLVANLKSDIANAANKCVTGQTQSCTSGNQVGTQTCVSGGWSACAVSGGLNYTLISALLLVIVALLAYKYRDRFFKGGEKVEPKKDYLSYYKR